MQIVKPSYVIEDPKDGDDGMEILRRIELSGRTCYKSSGFCEDVWDKDRTLKFIQHLIERGHESVLEHEKITVRFVVDRGVSHELVRHRIASFSQESTRYCNYSKEKFGNEITVIEPPDLTAEARKFWAWGVEGAEKAYLSMINEGCSAQIARSVLPTCLKTEIVVTANVREWRHIFKLRTAEAAHPQMREVMIPLMKDLRDMIPVVFHDINANQ